MFFSPFSRAVQFFKISIHLLQFYDKHIAFRKLSSFVFFHHCLLLFLLVSSSNIYVCLHIYIYNHSFVFVFQERERERESSLQLKVGCFSINFIFYTFFHYYLYIFDLHICGFVETLDWPFHFSVLNFIGQFFPLKKMYASFDSLYFGKLMRKKNIYTSIIYHMP